jgi:C4-dicarboxylate-specific signal transduction histidine kinase
MERQTIRILLVEDNPVDALLVRRMLAREAVEPNSYQLDHASALEQALDWLGKKSHDVILLDLNLPDSNGVETVRRVREVEPDLPIVVLTVAGDSDTAVKALRAGAQDYLVKEEITDSVLCRAIRYAMERLRIGEEKRQLQEQLHEAEKLQSLGVLAAGAAFGFNTLLGSILESADKALGKPDLATHAFESLNSIRVNALRAAEMVGQLRDYALTDRTQRTRLDVSRFVVGVSEMLDAIAGAGVSVQYHLVGGLPAIHVNPIELRQLLVNLLVNAAEAIREPEGFVWVETGLREVDAALLAETQGASQLQPGPFVFVRVGDSGPGLPAPARRRLFDPFFTTKHAGRGLGLSAAFGIVRRHGGAIHLGERQDEHGAEVEVLFPAGR